MWFVSRQMYWGVDPEDANVVEIAAGGRDYANPDMLCAKYDGEGKEYEDPREAAEAALEIAKLWRRDAPDNIISVAYGSTGGFTLPFEPERDDTYFDAEKGVEVIDEEHTAEKKLRQWAEETYDKLPKCDLCGKLLPEEYFIDESGEFKFCREYCAENWAARQQAEELEEERETPEKEGK